MPSDEPYAPNNDYAASFPEFVELCGHCGGRVQYRSNTDTPYCYRCSRAHKQPTVRYRRDQELPSNG
jgi:hypothetical protein